MKHNQYSQDVVNAVIKDLKGGLTRYRVMRKWGLSQGTVHRWAKQAGLEFSYKQCQLQSGTSKQHTVVQVSK